MSQCHDDLCIFIQCIEPPATPSLLLIIIVIIYCSWVAVVILHVHIYGGGLTRKFKLGGLYERHVVATWKLGNLVDTGKPRKTCVKVAGSRTFQMLASSQHSGI